MDTSTSGQIIAVLCFSANSALCYVKGFRNWNAIPSRPCSPYFTIGSVFAVFALWALGGR